VFALARFSPTVLAVPPLYEPENVSVPSVAERLARLEPSDIPEMVELVRPVLFRVPVTVGAKVSAPVVGLMVIPRVRPLKARVDVENVIAVAVVDE
jgi:hypothetical protein